MRPEEQNEASQNSVNYFQQPNDQPVIPSSNPVSPVSQFSQQIQQQPLQPQQLQPQPQQFVPNNQPPIPPVKKKFNVKLIATIAAVILLIGVGIFVLLGFLNKGGSGTDIFYQGKKVTSADVDGYKINSLARWGNIPVGVSYLYPKPITRSIVAGSQTQIYLHGQSFHYNGTYDIYVEKLINSNSSTTLDSLPIDIQKEKNSAEFLPFYNGINSTNFSTITKTEKIKVGNFDAVYFESENVKSQRLFGGTNEGKYIGYSIKINDKYICIYGEYVISETENIEKLNQYLLYVVSSIESYSGQSFYELANDFNLKDVFDGGFSSQNDYEFDFLQKNLSCDIYNINLFSNHSMNGIYKSFEPPILTFNDKNMGVYLKDLTIDNMADLVADHYSSSDKIYTKVNSLFYDSKIIDTTKVTINGVDMIKSVGEMTAQHPDKEKGKEVGYSKKYFVLYSMILNGKPHLFQYNPAITGLDNYDSYAYTEPYVKHKRELTEFIADTLIRTIRKIPSRTKASDLWKSDYIQ